MSGGDTSMTKVGVWWDLESCPVPDGFDPRCIRRSIESAMEKEIGRSCLTIVYATGNLEYISREFLEDMSRSGIVPVHAPAVGARDLTELIYRWLDYAPSPAKILLISDNYRWYSACIPRSRLTIYRAYPKVGYLPSEYRSHKEFNWETLLGKSSRFKPETEYICFCICLTCGDELEGSDCQEFFDHLKGQEHKDRLLEIVPMDNAYKPPHFCKVCQYLAYDEFNMTYIHEESDEHKRNVMKLKQAEEETEEEDCMSDNDLVKKAQEADCESWKKISPLNKETKKRIENVELFMHVPWGLVLLFGICLFTKVKLK